MHHLTCYYHESTPPFLKTDWAEDATLVEPSWCEWCAGTGHPYGDPDYGMCECPGARERLNLPPWRPQET